MRRHFLFFLLALASLGGTASQGRAEVVFDNLNQTPTTAITCDSANWCAQRVFFTGTTSYQLNSIVLLMKKGTGTGSPILQIYNGNGTTPTSSQYTLTSPGSVTDTLGNNTFTAGGTFLLNPNMNYWVVLKGDATSSYDWAYTDSNSGTGFGFQIDNATSDNTGASWTDYNIQPFQMQVNATAVPEPGTLALGAIALASGGVGTWWRRRRKATAESQA